ncbi:MAG: O-antigen ligase family protein [Clostridia bacterium]|nr:O-antigen ligase family protein [Clostridia bacterium]
MNEHKQPLSLPVSILAVYLFLLPLSAGLAGFIGDISLQNYVAILFIFISVLGFLHLKKIVVPNSIWLYGFWLYTVMSMFWTPSFQLSWYFTTFLLNVGVYICALSINYNRREQLFLKRAVLLGLFPVILATIFNIETAVNFRLIITVFSKMDPNDFGCGLVLIVALLFAMLLETDKKYPYVLLPVTAVIIILTGSRGAMIMFLTVFVTWLILSNVRKRFLIPFLLIAVFVAAFYAFYDYLPEFLRERLSFAVLAEDGGSGRLKIWQAALSSFVDFSPAKMFIGSGYGSFQESVHYIAAGHYSTYESHNIWVNTLIETGLLGLTLLVMLFVNSFIIAKRRKNYWGILSLVGLAVGGATLDMQAFRIFPLVFFVAISFDGKEDPHVEELHRQSDDHYSGLQHEGLS